MSKQDNVKWVFKGATGLYPYYTTFLVRLSKGGGDAVVVKEFDALTKTFVANGFELPESKSNVNYLDKNTLIVGTDFGAKSMTSSGYPRIVKLWKRGTPISQAKTIFEGDASDVSDSGYAMRDGDKSYLMVSKAETFYSSNTYVMANDRLTQLQIPEDADISDILNNQLIINLKSDWTVNGVTYKQGAIVSANFTSLIQGKKEIQLIFEPDAFSSVSAVASTKNYLLVNILNNVKSELYTYAYTNNKWIKTKVSAPELGTIGLSATDEFSDDYFFTFQNFLTPNSLYASNTKTNTIIKVKSLPSYFDATKYKVEQFKA